MDLKAFKEFYAANKDSDDVKTFVVGEFLDFAKTDNGMETLQPLLDSHGSKVVESYKTKGMEKEFEKRLSKEREKMKLEFNPPTNPLEQKVAELEAKYMKAENDKMILSVREKALKELKHPELSSLLNVTTDEEATLSSVKTINDSVENMINSAVEKRLKSSTRNPGSGNSDLGKDFFTQEQVSSISKEEISNNFDKIKESQRNW